MNLLFLTAFSFVCISCGENGSQIPASSTESLAPAEVLDLKHYYLTLPVKEDGTLGGKPARTIPTTKLSPEGNFHNGYSSEYFYAISDTYGDGIAMWCPVNGALSSQTSDSPRTELRHQVTPGTNDGWLPAENTLRSLTMVFSVESLPSQKESIIIAQLHGYRVVNGSRAGSNAAPLLLIYYQRDETSGLYRIKAKLRDNPEPANKGVYSSIIIEDNLRLHDLNNLSIEIQKNTIIVNNNTVYIDDLWNGVKVYFKAGVYLDAVGINPDDGARVVFYALDINV